MGTPDVDDLICLKTLALVHLGADFAGSVTGPMQHHCKLAESHCLEDPIQCISIVSPWQLSV